MQPRQQKEEEEKRSLDFLQTLSISGAGEVSGFLYRISTNKTKMISPVGIRKVGTVCPLVMGKLESRISLSLTCVHARLISKVDL